ncbi:MAG TPA: FkbM family methyltransferase [Pyrinomonadaceae bacterium]
MNLRRIAKGFVNRAAGRWGMELAYKHVLERPELRRDWLKRLPVRTVLDIGANDGDFAAEIRELLPEARIYSFEPLPDAHAALVARMRGDGRFRAFNFALGAVDSRARINRSSFSPSSSLLPMLDLHTQAWPHTAGGAAEEVEVRRLDAQQLDAEPELLVKMDVQGFEDKVIEGGRETLGRAAYVVTEVSFARLYEGQPLFEDIYRLLSGMGFAYRGSLWQLPDPRDGRPLQADAVFVRAGAGEGRA